MIARPLDIGMKIQRFLDGLDSWSLICGEALAILREFPSDSVDAVITDPPYSSGGFTRSDRNKNPVSKYQKSDSIVSRASFSGDNRDSRSWAYWCVLWISECLRIVKEGGYILLFCDWRQYPTAADVLQAGGFVWRGVVPWDKGEGAILPHRGLFRHQAEYVLVGTRGALVSADWDRPFAGVIKEPIRQSDKFHVTGKPTPVMRPLVQVVRPGGIILDPFFGSATTGVAAVLEGRRFIGMEQDAGNVAIGRQRLTELGQSVRVEGLAA